MRQSKLFARTVKEVPKDEGSVNARLLEQAGFVQKVMAGVYTFMPLGKKVLQKIEDVVRKEMDKVASEVLMPSLQPKENWVQTGRWESVDVLFKVKSQHSNDFALGPTHEEIISPAAQKIIGSYRDLPIAAYQIQTKFRDEPRAKSGLLRGREFRMKDLYSFHADENDLDQYYQTIQKSYSNIYETLGVKAILTEASGGMFSKFSHEYQVELPTGEDIIYVCQNCGLAKNKEIFSGDKEECSNCGKTTWRETKASEVGNIFKLGTKFTDPFEFKYTDESGNLKPVIMGCYGLGTSRLMGVIAELFSDDKGLIWPENIAPFQVHLIPLSAKDEKAEKEIQKTTQELHDKFEKMGVEVLLDDRDESAGVKFNDSDLIGIPYRLVISQKTLEQGGVEWKQRNSSEVSIVSIKDVYKKFDK